MTALGLVNAKCGFGFDLYLAKIGISSPDRAMEALYGASLILCRRFKSVTELDEKSGSAFSKLCVLLHTRITPVVRQAFADVTAAMVAGLPKSRYSPTKSITLTASRQNGQKLQRVFTPHTGRSGNQFGRARAFCAKRVTAKALSAMRVAATGKGGCWIRKRQRNRACRS
ncbi:TPA: hypothetical protein ACOEDM_000751 [Enterobacter hormaechei subsp. xiangfangensis]